MRAGWRRMEKFSSSRRRIGGGGGGGRAGGDFAGRCGLSGELCAGTSAAGECVDAGRAVDVVSANDAGRGGRCDFGAGGSESGDGCVEEENWRGDWAVCAAVCDGEVER